MNARDYQTDDLKQLKKWLTSEMEAGFKPTLAVVFCSLRDLIPEMSAFMSDHGIAVFGASSWGEFTRDGIERGSISVLLLDLPRESIFLSLEQLDGGDEEAAAERVARRAMERFENPALMVLISDLRTRGEAIVHTLEDVIGDGAQVAGAGAGTNSVTDPSYVFTRDVISNRGLLALIIDGSRVHITSRASCGWKAVGAPREITKSKGEWVYEIDGVPALDALLKYIGREDLDLDDPVQWEIEVNTLPLQLQRPQGDAIMRPALLYDTETRAVMCTGLMAEGSKVRFSIEPDDDVIETVLQDFSAVKDEAGDIDAVIYFSCWGRYNALGPSMNREIREAARLFGVPMVGLLSSGEMARATGGRLEFNALTSCCVMLKEVVA